MSRTTRKDAAERAAEKEAAQPLEGSWWSWFQR